MSNGQYRGIAPQCNLICAKVLDKKGGGSLKNLLNGLDWIIYMQKEYPIRILNISIEIDLDNHLKSEELSLLQKYLDYLWNENVLIVVAAGNRGPEPMSISPIGDTENCICVGCHDGEYIGIDGKNCASYSGRGPGTYKWRNQSAYNPLKKPDIVAPGTDIVSCNNKIFLNRKGRWQKPYVMKSGTSMAAPIVSGGCALCLQKYPKMTNTQLKFCLLNSAKDMGDSWSVQGAGMLQVSKMFERVTKWIT